MKNIIYIILFVCILLNISDTKADVVSNKEDKVFCDDGSYIEILQDTFYENTDVVCEVLDLEEKKYNISVSSGNKSILYTPKEMIFNYKKGPEESSANQFYYLDTYSNDWIKLNQSDTNKYTKINLFKIGTIKTFESIKENDSNKIDIQTLIYTILTIGMIVALPIYVIIKKALFKK